ncbi:MAG TPA: hypothetical protein VKB79_15320 [Bryobacteraceae bacterium]|nr:hypothetical protein [Bryobacteraceae bacterium]
MRGVRAACTQIQGALFDAIRATLGRFPQVHLSQKPRMADFGVWAAAAERGLGFADGSFLAAYPDNRTEVVFETLEGDTRSGCRSDVYGDPR